MTIQLRPHQTKAVQELSNGNILAGNTGSGKSLTAVAYYMKNESLRDVYVITTAKKRDSLDWDKEFAWFGVGRVPDATTAGVLVVDSWNSIHKYKDVEGAFFIFDEQRAVGAGKWAKHFIDIARRNQWILLSATPGDTWLDYIPVFVANGFYKNRTEFKREHVVYNHHAKFPKVDRYVNTGKLVRFRRQILVTMPDQRHTVRNTKDVIVDYDSDLLEKVLKDRWHVYEERPLRDIAEMFAVMRKVVNSDESRMNSVRGLLKEHPKVIVFYNFDYELEMLRNLASGKKSNTSPTADLERNLANSELGQSLTQSQTAVPATNALKNSSISADNTGPTSVLPADSKSRSGTTKPVHIAEWNGHKHEPIPDSSSWVYLVQYMAGAEGWNCIETDTVIFFSLTYSYKNFEQAKGRIDRLNTPYTDLNYYVLRSNSYIDKAIWKALSSKRSFNESSLRRQLEAGL